MYLTDLTDAQWNSIKNYLDKASGKRKYSLRSVWNWLMYVVKTGYQWRMLPKEFPNWQLVYYYYRKWVEAEIFDMLLDSLRSKVRVSQGQKARATLGIMDTQSVRWGNNRSLMSYDDNKKVKGIKRHIVVDKNGFLLAIMVTVAHIHDSKAVVWLMRILQDSYASIQTILADGGNQGGYNRNCNIEIRMLFKRVMRKDSNKGSFKPIHKR